MPTKEKASTIEMVKKEFDGATSVVVSHYRSLTVEEINDLRKRLRGVKAVHKVVKNTLAARAAKETKLESLVKYLEGPTVLTITKGDTAAAAKILIDFAKEHENLKIMGGVFEGKETSKEEIKAISLLPPREVLLTKLVCSLNSPLVRLVRVLNGPIQSLATVLKAV